MDKVRLLETSGELYSYYYTLEDTIDYYYGSLLPSTGYIRKFDIVKYYDGLLLRVPKRQNPENIGGSSKTEKNAGSIQRAPTLESDFRCGYCRRFQCGL